MISSTEWTQQKCGLTQPLVFQAALFSLPTLHLPLDPLYGSGMTTPWAPPQPRGSDLPDRACCCHCPLQKQDSPSVVPSWAALYCPSLVVVNAFICSQLHVAATASHAWERPALTVLWASRPFHMNKVFSIPFARSGTCRERQERAEPRILKGLPCRLYRSLSKCSHSCSYAQEECF